ncbi:MAG TPA: flagellar basal body rod protein FlgB [Candidatus Binatia bacterium]|nr:flagellar basal body rod protein FlgB [Candidatus Binatia bacterium]
MASILFDPTMRGLADALTLHARRHEVLASNLANVETPGFKAQELDFERALRDAFAAERTENDPADAPAVVEDASAPARPDGNSVDLDLEMAKLAANDGRYVALAKILDLRIRLLRAAIEGTR